MNVLPQICTSSEIYGHLSDTVLAKVPISGVSSIVDDDGKVIKFC